MIPDVGGLSNSGSMPISAGGGAAGDATASNQASFGGIKQGAVNMGGGGISTSVILIAVVGVIAFLMVKK